MMVRKPSVEPCSRASRPAAASIRPRTGSSPGPASASDARCLFGTIMKCTGAWGAMSWKASMSSSSYTLPQGISPATILQKMQSVIQWLLFRARGLLVDSRATLAPLELRQDVRDAHALRPEQDEAVEPEVRGLVDHLLPAPRLRREHRFGGFLAHFLEDRVEPFRVERRDVGRGRIRRTPLGDHALEAQKDVLARHRCPSLARSPDRFRPSVAPGPRLRDGGRSSAGARCGTRSPRPNPR